MGFLELSENNEISPRQVEIIRNHLNMVFVHEIDPSMPDTSGALAALHSGEPLPEGVIMRC